MGGLFGVASKSDCVHDLFFGTDYHSHLGTIRGGLAVRNSKDIHRCIHDITNTPFRSKFEPDLQKMKGNLGIGVISDYEDQPLMIRSHLGQYAIVTVGVVHNIGALAERAFENKNTYFSEIKEGEINPTEMIAMLINQADSFEAGLTHAQNLIEGSSSILLLTDDGIYASRDRLGRTPIAIGKKEGAYAAALETCAFPNLGFEIERQLGPGEIALITAEGAETIKPPGEEMKICSFLWVYYGYPASSYENINVEEVRNRCGAALARRDDVEIDLAAGVPDSGTAHAIGYANEAGVAYARPFVKYTPTWPRSFMPQDQSIRNLVAKMKLIPIKELIKNKKLLFCEDSVVRGTQLQDTIQCLYDSGAQEVHMRPACPPLIYSCKYLNFSRSKSEFDLAGRKAIRELGDDKPDLKKYADPESPEHEAMVDRIAKRLRLTSLKYQRLCDLVEAIGLPKDKLCTFCWDGAE